MYHPHHQTKNGILFICLPWHPFLLRSGFFLSPYPLWYASSGSNLACFFWVVSHLSRTLPRKNLSQNLKNRFFPLPTTKPCPLNLWPTTSPCLILAGYRLVVLGPCACHPSMCVQNLSAGHSLAVVWSLACIVCHLFLLTFYVSCFSIFHSPEELGFIWYWVLHFFWPIPCFLYFLQCRSVILAVITQSCWAFFGLAIYSFSQWLGMATGLLLLMGSYVPLGFPLGILGLFAFFGLPRPFC